MILQTEGAECGLACLAMVAAAHGLHSDLPTLRQRFSLSLKGLNLLDLVRMAESPHLHARALRAEIEDLAQLEHPCILHWVMNHFVELVGVSRGVAMIHDPTHGLRRLKLAQVSRLFTGVVLELTPAADFVLTAPEQEDALSLARNSAHIPDIELRDLSFPYSDAEPDVLCGVNLRTEPGESMAIVGPSGCGKTTLLKVILGIHAPQSDDMLIGGVPLSQLGLRAWPDMVGVVMQDEPLFSGSIADNISFFDLQPDLDWVAHCARVASVHDEIEAMPMGYPRSSATWARACRAGRSSASCWRARSIKGRRSCCSTRPPARRMSRASGSSTWRCASWH